MRICLSSTPWRFVGAVLGLISLQPARIYGSCAEGYSNLAPAAMAARPPHDYSQIHPAVQAWLESRQGELSQLAKFKVKRGGFLEINGMRAKVVALLGKGDEAAVYLVETPQGLRTAKVFESREKLVNNLREIRRFGQWGDLPRVERGDVRTLTLLMEYVDGIPISVFERPIVDFRMPPEVYRKAMARWEVDGERLSETAPVGAFVAGQNAVYVPRTDRVRVIDPH